MKTRLFWLVNHTLDCLKKIGHSRFKRGNSRPFNPSVSARDVFPDAHPFLNISMLLFMDSAMDWNSATARAAAPSIDFSKISRWTVVEN